MVNLQIIITFVARKQTLVRLRNKGKMPEWSNGPHSKCGVRVTVPGVRIPLFPPDTDVRAADSKLRHGFFFARGLRGALVFVSCSLTDVFHPVFLSVIFLLIGF